MKLSVVIPCLNGAATLGEQLEALAAQVWTEPWEILVADNGSTDGSRELVRRYQERMPHLRLVDAADRSGQPHALNVGAREASGEALLFCDADDVVGEGWLRAMGQALARHDFVAARIDVDRLNPPWVSASRRGTQEQGLQRIPYPPYLPHAGGGTLGVKRALHEAVGGFDHELPAIHDTLYCLRIQLMGTPLVFVPEAVVHMRLRATFSGIFRQGRSYGFYSTLLYRKSLALGTPKLPRPWKNGVWAWWSLARSLPELREKPGRARWMFAAGYRFGRLGGSLRHRVAAP